MCIIGADWIMLIVDREVRIYVIVSCSPGHGVSMVPQQPVVSVKHGGWDRHYNVRGRWRKTIAAKNPSSFIVKSCILVFILMVKEYAK